MSGCHFLPFPSHYPPPQDGGRGVGRGEGGGNDIFICSFKGSLLSPFKAFSFSFSHSFSSTPSVASRRSDNRFKQKFPSSPSLPPHPFLFSSLLLTRRRCLFCGVIARLINYKGTARVKRGVGISDYKEKGT